MFGLTKDEKEALDKKFAKLTRELLAEEEADGFAITAAMALVRGAEYLDALIRVNAALAEQLEAHRVSVEDLIAELQAMGEAARKPEGEG